MAIPSLFKLPSNKTFDLKTRYYDAEKEELEQRVERAKRDAGIKGAVNEKGVYIPNIKGQMMRHSIESRPSIAEESTIISRRWLVITIILTLIVYVVYKFDYISLFIDNLINKL